MKRFMLVLFAMTFLAACNSTPEDDGTPINDNPNQPAETPANDMTPSQGPVNDQDDEPAGNETESPANEGSEPPTGDEEQQRSNDGINDEPNDEDAGGMGLDGEDENNM